jgi:hypothetical protein
MKFSSLDIIVKSALLNKRLTLHYYIEALKHSSDCVREMAFDDMKIVNSQSLTVQPWGAITLPCDYIEWIRVGIPNGQYLKPLNVSTGMNRMYNYGPGGIPELWPVEVQNNFDSVIFGIPYLSWYVNSYNSRGENTGGLYGYRSDGAPMTFEVMKERNEIQLNQNLNITSVVLDYLSEGRTITNATRIDSYAEKSIETYIDYGMALNNQRLSMGEKEMFYAKHVRQREIYRARNNDLDTAGIINIFRKNYTATVKS